MNCLSDCWMSAQEALNYGLIDGIMHKESEMSDYEKKSEWRIYF